MFRPSELATSEEGAQVAAKIWAELLELFEITEADVLGK
jgi:hypothetical protein